MTATHLLRRLATHAAVVLLCAVSPSAVATAQSTGDVFIVLQTDPNGTVGSFGFTHTFGSSSNPVVASPFNLMDGRLQVFNRVSPGTYSIALTLQNGWLLVADGDGYDTGCWDDQENSTFNLEAGTASINVSAGEFIVCTFVIRRFSVDPPTANVQLLSAPRGVGYWKNWGGCVGAGGYNVIGSREAALARRALRKNSSLFPLGTLGSLTCAGATRLLSRYDLEGVHRANDAAYNLVSQLLAAKLNRAAGIPVPECVESAIAAADQLLGQVSFSGKGAFLGPGSGGGLRAQALQLAGQLGEFNGGTAVCQ